MGLFIGIIRNVYLKQMKSTYQWQLHLITQAKMTATKAASSLMQVGTDYESDSLIAKKLQERQYKLKLLEEKLEMINTELKSNQEMIHSGIQESFTYKAA